MQKQFCKELEREISVRGNECISGSKYLLKVNNEDNWVTSINFFLVFVVLIWKMYFPHDLHERKDRLGPGLDPHGQDQIRSEENKII